MKVLLVEDYRDNVTMLTRLLQLEGYEVDGADTKAAALARLRANRYDLAVLDLLLPDSEDLEALDAVRLAAPTMPIVVLSALDDPATAVEALKRGASFYLKKPVLPAKLLERMVSVMARP